MKVEEFLVKFGPPARDYYNQEGIFASVTLAQAALETGWAKFIPVDKHTGKHSYNLFGIKGTGPAGSVLSDTKDYQAGQIITVEARFKAYHNWYQSIEDHHKKLQEPRYQKVREAKDYSEAAQQLQNCGYATDPKYAWKLIKIIQANKLDQFDVKELPNPIKDAVQVLVQHGIISSPDFWIQNATAGKTIPGQYAAALILKTAAKLAKVPY